MKPCARVCRSSFQMQFPLRKILCAMVSMGLDTQWVTFRDSNNSWVYWSTTASCVQTSDECHARWFQPGIIKPVLTAFMLPSSLFAPAATVRGNVHIDVQPN